KLLAVAPEYQQQRIASALLDLLEQRLADAGATEVRVLEPPPNYLVPCVDLRYERAISLFTPRGYEPFAQAVNLQVDLSAWQPSGNTTGDDTTVVRRATPSDADSLRQLIHARWPLWCGEPSPARPTTPPALVVGVAGVRPAGHAAHHGFHSAFGCSGRMVPAADRPAVHLVKLKVAAP